MSGDKQSRCGSLRLRNSARVPTRADAWKRAQLNIISQSHVDGVREDCVRRGVSLCLQFRTSSWGRGRSRASSCAHKLTHRSENAQPRDKIRVLTACSNSQPAPSSCAQPKCAAQAWRLVLFIRPVQNNSIERVIRTSQAYLFGTRARDRHGHAWLHRHMCSDGAAAAQCRTHPLPGARAGQRGAYSASRRVGASRLGITCMPGALAIALRSKVSTTTLNKSVRRRSSPSPALHITAGAVLLFTGKIPTTTTPITRDSQRFV